MLDKILRLLEAGYTREEISTILGGAAPGNDNPTSAPVPAEPAPVPDPPAPVSPGAPVPVPGAPAPAGASDMAMVTKAIEMMGKNIISALQKSQLGGATIPHMPTMQDQIDAVTAQIINPTFKKGE